MMIVSLYDDGRELKLEVVESKKKRDSPVNEGRDRKLALIEIERVRFEIHRVTVAGVGMN
jgi:hypothetical protein